MKGTVETIKFTKKSDLKAQCGRLDLQRTFVIQNKATSNKRFFISNSHSPDNSVGNKVTNTYDDTRHELLQTVTASTITTSTIASGGIHVNTTANTNSNVNIYSSTQTQKHEQQRDDGIRNESINTNLSNAICVGSEEDDSDECVWERGTLRGNERRNNANNVTTDDIEAQVFDTVFDLLFTGIVDSETKNYDISVIKKIFNYLQLNSNDNIKNNINIRNPCKLGAIFENYATHLGTCIFEYLTSKDIVYTSRVSQNWARYFRVKNGVNIMYGVNLTFYITQMQQVGAYACDGVNCSDPWARFENVKHVEIGLEEQQFKIEKNSILLKKLSLLWNVRVLTVCCLPCHELAINEIFTKCGKRIENCKVCVICNSDDYYNGDSNSNSNSNREYFLENVKILTITDLFFWLGFGRKCKVLELNKIIDISASWLSFVISKCVLGCVETLAANDITIKKETENESLELVATDGDHDHDSNDGLSIDSCIKRFAQSFASLRILCFGVDQHCDDRALSMWQQIACNSNFRTKLNISSRVGDNDLKKLNRFIKTGNNSNNYNCNNDHNNSNAFNSSRIVVNKLELAIGGQTFQNINEIESLISELLASTSLQQLTLIKQTKNNSLESILKFVVQCHDELQSGPSTVGTRRRNTCTYGTDSKPTTTTMPTIAMVTRSTNGVTQESLNEDLGADLDMDDMYGYDNVNINTLQVIEVRDKYVTSTIPSITRILNQLSTFCNINNDDGTKPALLKCYFQISISRTDQREKEKRFQSLCKKIFELVTRSRQKKMGKKVKASPVDIEIRFTKLYEKFFQSLKKVFDKFFSELNLAQYETEPDCNEFCVALLLPSSSTLYVKAEFKPTCVEGQSQYILHVTNIEIVSSKLL